MAMSDAHVTASQLHRTVDRPAATFRKIQIQSTALFDTCEQAMYKQSQIRSDHDGHDLQQHMLPAGIYKLYEKEGLL